MAKELDAYDLQYTTGCIIGGAISTFFTIILFVYCVDKTIPAIDIVKSHMFCTSLNLPLESISVDTDWHHLSIINNHYTIKCGNVEFEIGQIELRKK